MQISQSAEFLVFSDSECICSKIGQDNRLHVIVNEVAKFEVRNEVTAIRDVVSCVL